MIETATLRKIDEVPELQKGQTELGFNGAEAPIMLWRRKRREMRLLPIDNPSIKREQDLFYRLTSNRWSFLTQFRNCLHE